MDYQVTDGYRVLGGGYLAGSTKTLSAFHFGLLELSDKRYLCLVEVSAPSVVITIFDTQTGERWPGESMDDPPADQEPRLRAESLLGKIQEKTKVKLSLAFSDGFRAAPSVPLSSLIR